MTEKLTLADCFKYCKATIIYEQEKFFGIGDFFRCSNPTLNISDCKLILRSIEQLTDEEKQYIAKNFLLVDWGVLEGRTNQITLIHIMSWCEFEKLKDLLDYFREIGVDIDGMFKSGKAAKDDK